MEAIARLGDGQSAAFRQFLRGLRPGIDCTVGAKAESFPVPSKISYALCAIAWDILLIRSLRFLTGVIVNGFSSARCTATDVAIILSLFPGLVSTGSGGSAT